jgi:hypothetical protein
VKTYPSPRSKWRREPPPPSGDAHHPNDVRRRLLAPPHCPLHLGFEVASAGLPAPPTLRPTPTHLRVEVGVGDKPPLAPRTLLVPMPTYTSCVVACLSRVVCTSSLPCASLGTSHQSPSDLERSPCSSVLVVSAHRLHRALHLLRDSPCMLLRRR